MTGSSQKSLHIVGASPARFELRLLGGFALVRDGHVVELSARQRRPSALLRFLAASGGRATRDDVIEAFWPESDGEKGGTNLRQVLYQLRRELGADPAPVIAEGSWVVLNPALRWEIDLVRFGEALDAAGDNPAALDAALELYGGEPLPEDRYEDWAAPIRERVQARYRDALLHSARLNSDGGSFDTALSHSAAALRLDPLDEPALRLQLETLVAAGRRAEALKSYSHFTDHLWRELGLEPEAETAELAARIERGELMRHDPVTAAPGPQLHNLPAPMSSFVGRASHVETLRDLLGREGVRLVTLVGPGGTGKTRLALEVGHAALPDHQDGVFLVSLAPLADAALVPQAVGAALGITERANEPIVQTMKTALASRNLMLILDNFEHVLPAAFLAAELLAACPGVTILATSRERLNLYGERVYPVPPLPIPMPEGPVDLDVAAQSEAIALFVDRAQAVLPDFRLTADNATAVATICHRLDGLPLAIELAAARTSLFGPEALLNRLEHRLSVATGGARDLPERQRSLRGAIDWSFSLLTPEEQTLFARLSVFAGGCTGESVEAVCDPTGQFPVLDIIESLREKNLVRVEGEDEFRITMLETVREYAAGRLAERDDGASTQEAHARYFLGLARAAEPELWGPRQQQWLHRLEEELDNLRRAMQWFLDNGACADELALASSLYNFWFYRAHWREGERWLELGLTGRNGLPIRVRGVASAALGRLVSFGDDFERARTALNEALHVCVTLQDEAGRSQALMNLAILASHEGRIADAVVMAEESLRIAREIGYGPGITRGLDNLSVEYTHAGDLVAARRCAEEALTLHRGNGEVLSVINTQINLSGIDAMEGKYGEAEVRLEESLDLSRSLNQERWIAYALQQLAALSLQRGDLETAERTLEESLRIAVGRNEHLNILDVLGHYASLALAQGNLERAATLKAAQIANRLKDGLPADAAEPGWREEIERIRNMLPEPAYGQATARGHAMRLEDAVAYALNAGE